MGYKSTFHGGCGNRGGAAQNRRPAAGTAWRRPISAMEMPKKTAKNPTEMCPGDDCGAAAALLRAKAKMDTFQVPPSGLGRPHAPAGAQAKK